MRAEAGCSQILCGQRASSLFRLQQRYRIVHVSNSCPGVEKGACMRISGLLAQVACQHICVSSWLLLACSAWGRAEQGNLMKSKTTLIKISRLFWTAYFKCLRNSSGYIYNLLPSLKFNLAQVFYMINPSSRISRRDLLLCVPGAWRCLCFALGTVSSCACSKYPSVCFLARVSTTGRWLLSRILFS